MAWTGLTVPAPIAGFQDSWTQPTGKSVVDQARFKIYPAQIKKGTFVLKGAAIEFNGYL
jgi:hypothetical protein